MKKLSIISSCYNERTSIVPLYQRVLKVMQNLSAYDFELIYVDNASTDDSALIYKTITDEDPRVCALLMSRNFGSNQSSILAGMHHASGDCVIIIDGDLQDPPELINRFVEQWEHGHDVVYGIRTKRKGSLLRRIGYTCFYRVFRMLSYLEIPLDAGDTSLIDRKIVDIIKTLPEKDLYIRGLRTWAGFKQTGIPYTREDRSAGVTSNRFFDNFTWAKKAIVNFSYKPLELITKLATAAVGITIIAAGWYLYRHFMYGSPRGFATLLMVMFIFGTLQLIVLSVIAEYLLRMFHEIKARPPYIVSQVLHKEHATTQPSWITPTSAHTHNLFVCSDCKKKELKEKNHEETIYHSTNAQ